ncbi:hypothetical protein PARHAE_01123 [Paracoccus haematequi]|uniref:Uncharacterized protein n=1 Tax=Paracoccus haematequi TaxID=2491866 RepID=A0A447IKA1_9RHOB|nr:hypothetical protein PARHAE_01123 [Paracoccus haematequi]
MPAHTVSREWTAPLELAAGDILQNRGVNKILISRSDPASELDALSLAPGEAFRLRSAMSVRASTAGPTISRLVVVRGLALTD